MKKVRVLQINKFYYPKIGGIEKVVRQVSESLVDEERIDSVVLCCQTEGGRNEEVINEVRVFRAGNIKTVWGLPLSLDFFNLFSREAREADIIDIHHPFPLADIALFFFKPKAKIVVHYHSDIVRQKLAAFFIRPLIFNTLKRAEKIIVSNPNVLRNSSYLRAFRSKSSIIPFGVNPRRFGEFRESQVSALKRKYGDFVLFVGRLSYYKGITYLLRAMRTVEANLVIVGSGEKRRELEKLSIGLGVSERVHFLGWVSKRRLISLYNACSVFVLPSIYKSEAFGIVLIEAMSCGKPVISTELGTGTSWINQNEETGLVVPPKNPDALASALNAVWKDKKKAREMGVKARQRVSEKFTLGKMMARHIKLYKNL